MDAQLLDIQTSTLAALSGSTTVTDVLAHKNAVLGKTGSLAVVLKGLKDRSDEDKRTIGKEANDLKKVLEDAFSVRISELEKAEIAQKLASEFRDMTAVFGSLAGNHIHPIHRLHHEIADAFVSMGFSVFQSPQATTEYENFDAVNVPATHPARDMQDTFWLEGKGRVLATQTSCMQNSLLRKYGPEVRAAVIGHVFRNEEIDARHDSMFDQVECVVTGKGIGMGHLKWTLETLLQKLFAKEVTVRMRPGFFPFVEPGVEVDFSCPFCKGGSSCKVCKGSGWVEFMGAGLIHPNVLTEAGIDAQQYTGFAFGFGLTRLAMIRYMVDDIRHFSSGNTDFLKQF